MSAILDIYAALASKTITLRGNAVKCYNLADLKNSIETAQTPARLLLPLGTPTEGRNFGFMALGRTLGVSWQIVDLFLYKPVTRGLGMPEVAELLIDYAGQYVDMLQTFRAPTNQSYIENATIAPGLYEWPRDSGVTYTGVEVLLEVREIKGG